jgi:hypothetical protein
MVTDILYSSLMYIFIYLIYQIYVRDWCNGGGIWQELTQFRKLLHETHRLRLELKDMLALEKEEEETRHAQILKEMNSMKKIMKEEEKRCSEFQNEINFMKNLMKYQGGEHAQFQNAIDAATNMMNKEKKRYAKFSDEIYSMNEQLDIPPPIEKEPDSPPVSEPPLVNVRAPEESQAVAPNPPENTTNKKAMTRKPSTVQKPLVQPGGSGYNTRVKKRKPSKNHVKENM